MIHTEVIVERLTSYSSQDAAGIGRLMPFLSASKSGDPIPKELLSEIIHSPYHEQLIARLGTKIVGTATLNMLMGPAVHKAGYLEDFVTDPGVREKGVGSKIWDEMLVWCKDNGVGLEFTSRSSREAAHRFYLAKGAEIRDTTVFHVDVQ